MDTLNGFFRYRPIKIGWCIIDEDFESLRKAINLSFCFWGGNFNPLIPIKNKQLANNLIKLFKVDVLYPVKNDPEIINFINEYPYLKLMIPDTVLFKPHFGFLRPMFLDVTVPASLFNKKRSSYGGSIQDLTNIIYDKDDPLKDIVNIEYGKFYDNKIDYDDKIKKYFNVLNKEITTSDDIYGLAKENLTISKLASYNLFSDNFFHLDYSGIYSGSVNNFYDILNYWNLKASKINVKFFDHNNTDRFKSIYKSLISKVAANLSSPTGYNFNTVSIWYIDKNNIELDYLDSFVNKTKINDKTWDGSVIKPPQLFFQHNSKVGINIKNEYSNKVNYPLIDIPEVINNERAYFAISYNLYADNPSSDSFFNVPYIPELNQFYGSCISIDPHVFRAGDNFDNIIIEAHKNFIDLFSINHQKFLNNFFKLFNLKVQISIPGLVTKRVIEQFNGLMGCKVLRIEGCRDLISQIDPNESLDGTRICEIICQGKPEESIKVFIERYNDLPFPKKSKNIHPHDIFKYLIEYNVFRVGLDIKCPKCDLPFWKNLNDLKDQIICEYCGNSINILLQLKDRNWRYRRSGIFGNSDNQQGAIPTILTLMTLSKVVSSGKNYFFSSIEINNMGNNKIFENPMEIDFMFMNQENNNPLKIVIGECKSKNSPIDRNDFKNLITLKELLETKGYKVFILISKLNFLTEEELSIIKELDIQIKNQLIILTHEELDHYFPYEKKHKKNNGINISAISLEDMVMNTMTIYF